MALKDWNLFLDDIRDLSFSKFDNDNWFHSRDWIIARSFEEAVKLIQDKGFPTAVAFDHDLGEDEQSKELPNGYDFAKWLVEQDLNGIYNFPENFEYRVHSDNPVGARNISGYLDSYFKSRSLK